MTKEPIKTGEYVTPEINVIEIKSQGILCASTAGMSFGDPQDGDSLFGPSH